MYYKMFTNESKEYMEYADYTFEEHFKGKNVPSYMPRAVIREYLIGKHMIITTPKPTYDYQIIHTCQVHHKTKF